MTTEYEWDVEEVADGDSEQYEDGEVIDHNHQSSYADCLKWIRDMQPPAGSRFEVVLVRDRVDNPRDIVDRSWAYMVDGKLPEYFIDAIGQNVVKVPKRFHEEVEKASK